MFCERAVGDRHGPTVGWHKNGQKSFELEYVNGRPSGPIRAWWENGQTAIAGDTSPDNGRVVVWDEAGRKRAEIEVRQRRPDIKAWDENGRDEPYDESRLFVGNRDLPMVMMLFGVGIGIR